MGLSPSVGKYAQNHVAGATFDVIVIGGGAMGSAAAYHAARDGQRVLLLEQFTVGHRQGSSHGDSRIIRYTHDSAVYAGQMPATFELWRELQHNSGAPLLQMTGGLYMGPPDGSWLQSARRALSALAFPHEVLDAEVVQRRYPQLRLPAGWIGVTQEHSGILAANRCVAVMVSQAVQHGATVREETPVTQVTPLPDGVAVQTPHGVYYGARAIITAGPWASHFLQAHVDYPIPLRVTRQQVAYFAVHDPAGYAAGRFPVFIFASDPHFYGIPAWERPGQVKLSLEQSDNTVDPNDMARPVDEELLGRLCALTQKYFVGMADRPAAVETCLYTETPTRDFVIDRHAEHPQMVFGAGFSGRGFKHAIAIGRLLADLAQGAAGDYSSPFWREAYRLDRFAAAQA